MLQPQDPDDIEERLRALRKLRADGVRTARFGEDEVTYKSDAEMAAAIADLERRVSNAAARPAVTFVNFRSQRGWS